jgi:hypothetical protein
MGFGRPALRAGQRLETGAVLRDQATSTQKLRVRECLKPHPALDTGASSLFYGVKALQHRGKLHRFTEVEQFRRDHTPVVIGGCSCCSKFCAPHFSPNTIPTLPYRPQKTRYY